jgi:hypothetical protein
VVALGFRYVPIATLSLLDQRLAQQDRLTINLFQLFDRADVCVEDLPDRRHKISIGGHAGCALD